MSSAVDDNHFFIRAAMDKRRKVVLDTKKRNFNSTHRLAERTYFEDQVLPLDAHVFKERKLFVEEAV